MITYASNDMLILSSNRETIQNLDWYRFLKNCGYEVTAEKDQTMTVLRRGIKHQLAIARPSDSIIQIRNAELRFPIARLLGCIGFHIQSRHSRNVAFEIYKVLLTDELIGWLGKWCTSISQDSLTRESDMVIERIFNICPKLLLPKVSSCENNNVFAHYININTQDFIGISSDKYDYSDWKELSLFNEVRRVIDDHGGQCLGFTIEERMVQ